MANPDLMSLIAAGSSFRLLFDQPESGRFYLYNLITKSLTLLSDQEAQDLYKGGTASWTLPGSTYFGQTAQNNLSIWYPQLQSPQPVQVTVLVSEDGKILTTEGGDELTP